MPHLHTVTFSCASFVFFLQKTGRGIWFLAVLKLCPVPLAKFLIYTGLIKHLSSFFKMAPRSLTEVVNELTDNKDLRAVFSYIFGTYGEPRRTSGKLVVSFVDMLLTASCFYL